MILKKPSTDCQEVLYALLMKRSLTTIELKQSWTKSSYPPARLKDIIKKGVSIGSKMERYINRRGKVSHIARYTLLSPMVDARRIYQKMCA